MIDALIYEKLCADEQLAELLATYSGKPAIFYAKAAPDAASGWGKERYPRIDFVIDIQSQPARNIAGALILNIWCDMNAMKVEPSDIERQVRKLLHLKIVGEDSIAYCFTWTRSDNFEVSRVDEECGMQAGYTMIFSVVGMPKVVSTYPCPLEGINQFTKLVDPDGTVIGLDTVEGWLEEGTAYYWDISNLAVYERWNVCRWYNVTLQCRVFAQSDEEKVHAGAVLLEHLTVEEHVKLEDGSPMHTMRVSLIPQSDSDTSGQVQYQGRYGVLVDVHRKKYHPDEYVEYEDLKETKIETQFG